MFVFGIVLLVVFAAAAVGIVIGVLFLLNLMRLLEAVQPQNRAMSPGLVWLNFIPIFGQGWMIYTVLKIKESVQRENASRWGAPIAEGNTHTVGLVYAILGAVGLVFSFGRYASQGLSVFSGVIALAGLITWIMYWVKTSGLRTQLVRTANRSYGQTGPYGPSGQYGAGGPYVPGPVAPTAWQPPGGPETERACAQCGRKLNPDDQFCASCGTPVPKE